jgi:hypothetical protein
VKESNVCRLKSNRIFDDHVRSFLSFNRNIRSREKTFKGPTTNYYLLLTFVSFYVQGGAASAWRGCKRHFTSYFMLRANVTLYFYARFDCSKWEFHTVLLRNIYIPLFISLNDITSSKRHADILVVCLLTKPNRPYADCWQLQMNNRPLQEQASQQLQTTSGSEPKQSAVKSKDENASKNKSEKASVLLQNGRFPVTWLKS